MKNIKIFLSLAFTILLIVWGSAQVLSQDIEPTSEVVLESEVNWSPLNPARGDQGPKAGNLWGDRTGSEASGFLVQFVDGFSSPPHIHNVTYRGVAIAGLLHNDDPNAEKMWMPKGSFWTQPAGEVHITAADGDTNLAYIEIDSGPYLVNSAEEAFDNGEKPINVYASNIVWLDASKRDRQNNSKTSTPLNDPKIAFLWGNPEDEKPYGTMIELPAGFTGDIHSYGSTFRAVVIKGQAQYQVSGKTDVKILQPGSYFGSKGESTHQVSSEAEKESIIYVRTDGKLDINPA